MKINLGSGFRKIDGYVNVDYFKESEPDVLMNLEETPWQFESDSADEIAAIHVLEHIGESREAFFNVIKEIYRVLKHGGLFRVAVPHYMHRSYYSDPTHVRAFTTSTFQMLSKNRNRDWMKRNVNATMLGMMLDVDFEMIEVSYTYDPAWARKIESGEVTKEQVREIAQERWGVIQELKVVLRAKKTA